MLLRKNSRNKVETLFTRSSCHRATRSADGNGQTKQRLSRKLLFDFIFLDIQFGIELLGKQRDEIHTARYSYTIIFEKCMHSQGSVMYSFEIGVISSGCELAKKCSARMAKTF